MHKRNSAIILISLFLVSIFAPMSAMGTGGRSADFDVTTLLIDGGGSIEDPDNPGFYILQPTVTHTVVVIIENLGTSTGAATVELFHQDGPTADEIELSSFTISTLAPGAETSPINFDFDNNGGDGQKLIVRITSSQDSVSGNNEEEIRFSVAPYVSSAHLEVSSNPLPAVAPGDTSARVTRGAGSFAVNVENTGVSPFEASLTATFTPTGAESPIGPFTSPGPNPTPAPSSIYDTATGVNADLALVEIDYDSTAWSGTYTLALTLSINAGAQGTTTEEILNVDVTFSDYAVEITAPQDRAIEPGLTTTLSFILKNVGSLQTSFGVSVTDSLGWTEANPPVSTGSFDAGTTATYQVDVTVDPNAARGQTENVQVTFTNNDDPDFAPTFVVNVMAAESYGVTVTMPSDVVMATPGVSMPIPDGVEVTNSGNTASTFTLTAGLSAPAQNWVVELDSQSVYVPAGESAQVGVQIKPPEIKNPINPSEYNRAGDALSVWVMASSVHGGIPSQGFTPIEIAPVLTVDPGLESTDIYLTAEDVIMAKNGQGVDVIVDMSIEARHNLIADLDGKIQTVDLEIGEVNFYSDEVSASGEEQRWSTPSITPEQILEMSIDGDGSTYVGSIGIQGPVDNFPTSGYMEIEVITTPTVGATSSLPASLSAEAFSTMFRIHVPTVNEVELTQSVPFQIEGGEANTVDVPLANLGNNLSDYTLTLVDELPVDWGASFSTSDVTQTTSLTSVKPVVANLDPDSTQHISTFPLTITPPADALANTIENVRIIVENGKTGEYIGTYTVEFVVIESRAIELDPTEQQIELAVGESIVTRITISNQGNTPTMFNIAVDDSGSDEVDFEIDSSDSVLVGAGFETTVKIRLTASENARSDELYTGIITVTTPSDTDVSATATITANITENHGVDIDPLSSSEVAVVPGVTEEIEFQVENLGNLAEDVEVTIEHSEGWSISNDEQLMNLDIGEIFASSFTLNVPSFDGSPALMEGASHILYLNASTADGGLRLDTEQITVSVGPKFIPTFSNWEDNTKFAPRGSRVFNVGITNDGNQDVTVAIDYAIYEPGLSTESSLFDWQASTPPTTMNLPMGVEQTLSFFVLHISNSPELTDAGQLVVTITPTNEGVTGSGQLTSVLSLSRFFTEGDNKITTKSATTTSQLNVSHITEGVDSVIQYELEFCGAERMQDIDALNLNETDYQWMFTLEIDGQTFPIDLSEECGSTSRGTESRYLLPLLGNGDTYAVSVITQPPVDPYLLAGDGWELEFRLYHPDNNAGYTVYDSDTWRYMLDVVADPMIRSLVIKDDAPAMEGKEITIVGEVYNEGSAQAFFVMPSLTCTGADITSNPEVIPVLGPTSKVEVNWTIIPHTLDWFDTTAPLDCEAKITGTGWVGNTLTNDRMSLQNVERISYAPSIALSFVAFVGLFLLAFVFSRLRGQSEQWGYLSLYSGVLALGFSFYLLNVEYYGFAVLGLTALYVWRSAWKSGEEFRLIHEDYQRARKGNATVYADHFQALRDGRRQMFIILSLPVMGLYAVILGVPPQLPDDNTNLGFLGGYFVVVALGVMYLLRRSDRIYGNLYGRLTDAEVKSIRLDRDLRDPARLLNELADDGIDFERFFEPETKSSSSPMDAVDLDMDSDMLPEGGDVDV